MRKKRVKKGIIIAIVVLVFLVIAGIGIAAVSGSGFMIGRLLIQDESYMVVNEEEALYISVSDSIEEKLRKMSTGDKVLLVHGDVLTSFPGNTDAKYVLRLSMGDESDLPQNTLEQFILPTIDEDMLGDMSMVECSYQENAFSLQIPDDWEYEFKEYNEEDYFEFGMSLWPEGQEEGRVEVLSTEFFGVCGTGLESKQALLGKYQVNIGTYDNHEVWDFITFHEAEKDYVILNAGAENWWDEHGEEAMQILSTIQVYKKTVP